MKEGAVVAMILKRETKAYDFIKKNFIVTVLVWMKDKQKVFQNPMHDEESWTFLILWKEKSVKGRI